MEKHVLYFAHPVNTYNTDCEVQMLSLIQLYFPHYVIENPNQPHHQEGYKKWKKENENIPGKSGMSYFFDIVLPACDAGTIALPFLDGKIGAGVAGEVIYAIKQKRGVWLIEAPKLKTIRSFTPQEIELLLDWEGRKNKALTREVREDVENAPVLSIKETRIRTWKVLYKVFKPYSEAHLDKIMLLE